MAILQVQGSSLALATLCAFAQEARDEGSRAKKGEREKQHWNASGDTSFKGGCLHADTSEGLAGGLFPVTRGAACCKRLRRFHQIFADAGAGGVGRRDCGCDAGLERRRCAWMPILVL